MPEPTRRGVIRAEIEEWALVWREGPGHGFVPMLEAPLDDLAARIDEALSARRVGSLLTAEELELYRRWAGVGHEGSPLGRLLAHIDAQDSEQEALGAEVCRALRFSRSRGPDRDYVVQYGSGIKPSEVPRIAALLRDPQPTRQEDRR